MKHKTIDEIGLEMKAEIIAMILDRIEPHKIMQKYHITYYLLKEIRNIVYPIRGQKIYPIYVASKNDAKHSKGLSQVMHITEQINKIKKGQMIYIKYYTSMEIIEAEVIQTNNFAIFVKINNRIECINIADLVTKEYKISGVCA